MDSGTLAARRSRLRLRLVALASAGAGGCAPLIAPGAASGRGAAQSATAIELATVDGINAIRAAHGLEALSFSPGLFASALLHDRQMVGGGYFGHDGPDGADFAARIQSSYPPGHAVYYAIGENLF